MNKVGTFTLAIPGPDSSPASNRVILGDGDDMTGPLLASQVMSAITSSKPVVVDWGCETNRVWANRWSRILFLMFWWEDEEHWCTNVIPTPHQLGKNICQNNHSTTDPLVPPITRMAAAHLLALDLTQRLSLSFLIFLLKCLPCLVHRLTMYSLFWDAWALTLQRSWLKPITF
ncbi:hypothetical protein BJ742DRAFT_153398 [Cladochytrium replicatum]|nr:hypothetical protein BJ742DRAFT_153398 [Cladochytrium replicatum]